ncbi:hotdog domain-containing protein [Actinomadura sp. LOL_016]|uniref:hotdog domain-containing protein n=1 Tax=unclassified Actinomadura TaxID=2626254 RepID=UPI003A801D4E
MDLNVPGPAVDDTSRETFLTALGLRILSPDGDVSRATARLGPAVWARGTERPRLGALATMADVVAGLRPTGAVAPTVDLNVRLFRPPPSRGRIDLEGRPLKAGRRLFVGEVLMRHEGTLFARSVATFMNRPPKSQGGESDTDPFATDRSLPAVPFDDWFRPRYVDARTILVERTPSISNGPGATIQGGAQATVAESAAEWALAPRGAFVAVDLDIRYLGPVLTGPLAATAEVLAVHDDRAFVSVRLTDTGAGDATVADVTVVCRPRD